MKILVRPVEGISLNGNEVLLDKDNKVSRFETTELAVVYLNSTLKLNYTEEEYWDKFSIGIEDEND